MRRAIEDVIRAALEAGLESRGAEEDVRRYLKARKVPPQT